MSTEEFAAAFSTVEEIDNDIPDGVILLSMMETEDKADSFFDQQDEEVAGFDCTDGFAVWNLDQGGTYWIFYQMTAEDARPLFISINDDMVVEEGICNDATGSWESDALQRFHYGPFTLDEGSLKVHTDGY
jgi:hypothetical protein